MNVDGRDDCSTDREPGSVPSRLERFHNRVDRFLDRLAIRFDQDVRRQRRLVRIGDAGEVLDFAAKRFCVQAFAVALDELVDRAADVDLDERRFMRATDFVADVAIRRDGGADRDDAVARQQSSDEADAANVRVAIFLGESQSFAQVRAHLIAVENLDASAARHEALADALRERRFPGAGQAGEPEREAGRLAHRTACSRMPSISTRATSARVNSGGGTSPLVSICRTCVPLSVTRADSSCGHVLVDAIPPHREQ